MLSSLFVLGTLACGPLTEALSPPPAQAAAATRVYEAEILSKPYHIDRKYASMMGPYGLDRTTLRDGAPELLWIVGYESEVIDSTSRGNVGQQYMCHANLDIDPNAYFDAFPTAPSMSGRLFTLSQGQRRIDFPPGFGIPIPSDMDLSLATQVLNLNEEDIDKSVQHKVKIRYIRDSEVNGTMTALFQAAVEGFKALDDARFYGVDMAHADTDELGPGCSVGQAAVAGDFDEDGLGQKFTAHWVVEPGVEVNRTNVTRFLNLPYDTRAHYVAVHLHPFAESLELWDLTTNQVVYKAQVDGSKGRVGIDKVDFYSSVDGIEFVKGHEYELVSRYNNTSGEKVDSMAVMYLYLADQNFKKPAFESQE